MIKIERKPTKSIWAGDLQIGGGSAISVQSMCATHTRDVEATVRQIEMLRHHGADLIRVAVDGRADVEALAQIRKKTEARLVVDLQESYRLAAQVAPFVQKIRYNPGHLHHHEKAIPVREKVKSIVEAVRPYRCAIRIGINFGSLDPGKKSGEDDASLAALASAREHIGFMQEFGFDNYLVSLKSSNPNDVIDLNRQFSTEFPHIPLHLGVTEAGMLPMGEVKTRVALEALLAQGIGDTVRVSLTLPFEEKYQEILVARRIIEDVQAGRFRSVPRFEQRGLNIISCPSCSRVENEAFVELAQKVKEVSAFAAQENITIAVMGCRVNGPGETDDADLGLWCAPTHVNLKRKGQLLGAFRYDEILHRVRAELEALISSRKGQ